MANEHAAIWRQWLEGTQRLEKAISEVYHGNADIYGTDISFKDVRAYSERMAWAAANAGNSGAGRQIKAHFIIEVAPVVAKFERVKECAEDIAKCMEARRTAETDVAYEFDSFMIEGHLGEIAGMIGNGEDLYNILHFDFFRDNMINLEIAERLGLVELPPKTGEYRHMKRRLYDIVSECSREFDVRQANPDGTPMTDQQKEEHDRKEVAKAATVARGMSYGPEKAMEMFIAFGAQSLALIANGKQPVANIPKILVDYVTYAFMAMIGGRTPHEATLTKALTHDFGLNGKESIAAESLCHNHTVIYLRKGLGLKEAQARAREDLSMLESVD
jgi:hypothetical protein